MVDVKLHDIGEGMHEAEILQFLVDNGDVVEVDAPLVEIQTDKMTAELTAPSAGTVTSIEVQIGDVVEVGDTILKIGDTNDKEEEYPKNNSPQEEKKLEPVTSGGAVQEQQMNVEPSSPRRRRVLAAPYTRKIAREHDIDIEQVKGTGPAGRVMDEDIYEFIKSQTEVPTPAPQRTKNLHETKENSKAQESTLFPTDTRAENQFQVQESRPFLRTSSALQSVSIETKAIKELSKQLEISFLSFLTKGVQIAIRKYPQVNARVSEGEQSIYYLENYNFIVHSEGVSHSIPDVSHQSIQNIEKQLTLESESEEDGGTFTIYVSGNNASISSSVLSAGQTASLTVSPEVEKPAVHNGKIVISTFIDITLAYDTRAMDGFEAAAFLARMKDLLEDPNLFLVELV